ncbi:MAG: hypothetical protein UHK54_09630 [Acutalibacteraceae bacterium]|nr:hypothetical protein [Acutalibacteraceae bacterium]
MKKYFSQNKDTAIALSFAGAFLSIIATTALVLSEVSPSMIF